MKTNRILTVLAAMALTPFAHVYAAPVVVVDRVIVLNGTADEAALANGQAHVVIASTGADDVNNFGTALRIRFTDGEGDPMNVTGFKATAATYTLYKDNVVVTNWNAVQHGAYNPIGDSAKPDLLARDANGTQVSPNGTQVVGTTINQNVASVLVLDQQVTLGTASRPKFPDSGQTGPSQYRLDRSWSFEYTWDGNLYVGSVSPPQTSVSVTVIKDPEDFNPGETPGPFNLNMQVSKDLATWHQVALPGPYPSPESKTEFVLFVNAALVVAGQVPDGKGFLRTKYVTP